MRAGLGGKLTRGQGIGSRGAVAAGVAPPPSETQYLDLTSVEAALWTNSSVTAINDGTRDPSVPSAGFVSAENADDNKEQVYNVEVGDAGSYDSLLLKSYANRDNTPDALQVRLEINGVWTAYQTLTTEASAQWYTHTFEGPFTLPLSSLKVAYKAGNVALFARQKVYGSYIEAVPAS